MTDYSPSDALRDKISAIEGAPSAEELDDLFEEAARVIVKRDGSGFLIVTEQKGPATSTYSVNVMQPPNDKELLDRAYELYGDKKLVLDYGDAEGAKKYIRSQVESKMVSQVMRQKTGKLIGSRRRKARRSTRRKIRKMKFRV